MGGGGVLSVLKGYMYTVLCGCGLYQPAYCFTSYCKYLLLYLAIGYLILFYQLLYISTAVPGCTHHREENLPLLLYRAGM